MAGVFSVSMNLEPPSIGRIVGYRPIQSASDKMVRPAMIVEVPTDDYNSGKDRVSLQVLSPIGPTYLMADWSEQGDRGTWFWLPDVAKREEVTDASDTEARAPTTETAVPTDPAAL